MTNKTTLYSGGPASQTHEQYVEFFKDLFAFSRVDTTENEDEALMLVGNVAKEKGVDAFKLIRITIETYDPNAPAHDNL